MMTGSGDVAGGGDTLITEGVMLLWFGLTALSVAFVAVDIRSTPENVVLKWGLRAAAGSRSEFNMDHHLKHAS